MLIIRCDPSTVINISISKVQTLVGQTSVSITNDTLEGEFEPNLSADIGFKGNLFDENGSGTSISKRFLEAMRAGTNTRIFGSDGHIPVVEIYTGHIHTFTSGSDDTSHLTSRTGSIAIGRSDNDGVLHFHRTSRRKITHGDLNTTQLVIHSLDTTECNCTGTFRNYGVTHVFPAGVVFEDGFEEVGRVGLRAGV